MKLYIDALYSVVSGSHYGRPIGAIQRAALGKLMQTTGPHDFLARIHAEQVTLHGDPAMTLYPHAAPDYVVEEPQLRIQPAMVSVADAGFDVDIRVLNIGKAVPDTVGIRVWRQLPTGSRELLLQKLTSIAYQDSIRIRVPVRPLSDKGENRILVEGRPRGEGVRAL